MVVLLLSNKWDISIDYVIKNLREQNCEYLRINTEDIVNLASAVSFPRFSYWIKNKRINLAERLHSVLLRRPEKPFSFTETNQLSTAAMKYVADQWHSFIFGLETIPHVLWINNPHRNSFAEIKINQLACAEKIGFKIPKTLITNKKYELQKFFNLCNGKIIAKSLYAPLIRDNENEYFIFSNRISNLSDVVEAELSLSPVIFQEELQNKIDYRVTVIGSTCFVAEITYEDKSVLDWRVVKNNIHINRSILPNDIVEKCMRCISELNLQFGAIDLIKANDEYYFLEINPNGEWGWLQKKLEFPIAEAITEQLITGRKYE